MINLVWSGLLTLLLLSGCGFDGTPSRLNDFVPLTSIEITAVSPTIATGTSTTLKVTGNFSGLFTRDITDQAVWSSGSATVADFVTAASPNRVTGRIPGTATLTATVGGVTSTFNLTVSSATLTALTISPAAPSIAKGLTTQFAASGTFSDSKTQDLTFDATWASSAPAVATVSNDPGSKGFVQTLAAGTATISASFFDGVSGTTLLTVTEPVLQSITVTPDNPSILSLSSGSFTATGHFTDGTTPDITSQVAWTSSNSNVATITATGGSVTTLSQGNAIITASLNDVNGTSLLKVTGGTLNSFAVSPADVTLVKGTVARMTVSGTFDNGAIRDITGFVPLLPAPGTNFATVTKPGGNLALLTADNVTPVGTPTIITASVTLPSRTLSATTNLSVTAPTPLTLTINPPNAFVDMTAGTSARFTATATFNGAPNQDVTTNCTWTTGNTAIATVGDIGIAKGRVTGVATGTTTINATYVDTAGATVTALPVTTISVVTRTLLSSQPVISTPAVTSGNQVQFTATANYNGGISKDVTEDTSWSSDNKNVFIMADDTNQPGQVVGVNTGSTSIRASFGGNTTTATITVP